MKALRLAIIIGSTRPGRNGEAVAKWVYEIAQKRSDAEFELVDIKDYNLPLLDEPVPPSMGQYSKPHTKKWAAKVGSFDGYVFVTPRVQPQHLRRAQERHRFSVRRVEQQGCRLR
jgi:NAD(P)H-dependent FMN reductase